MKDLLEFNEIPETAKAGIRYLSTGFDYFLIMAITNLTYGNSRSPSTLVLIVFVLSWIVYFPIIEGISGQTLGKRIFKLKVLKEDYSKLNILNSFFRRLFDFIDFLPTFGILGLIVASSNSKIQRIGDLVAKTIVVKV